MRTARALFVIAVCGLTAAAVPAARASAHSHSSTVLRSGDDDRKAASPTRKRKAAPSPSKALSKALAERSALGPVIAELDRAFRKLPADSDWRSAVLRIRDCMELDLESIPSHLGPTSAPAREE